MSGSTLQRNVLSALAALLVSAVMLGATIAPDAAIAASPISQQVVYA
ncbi:MAG: hypothetical protein KJO02_02010 [Erythrobacter sp.]|nr:hypothetical protein [Sphingomicrobium marinum]MBT8426783.1 hypothetical protein [Erythrobacter sp.]NNC47199.1 hypothetical protein [Sphingomonas sp.]